MADNMEHQTERAYQKQHGVNAGCVAATTLGHGVCRALLLAASPLCDAARSRRALRRTLCRRRML